MFGLYQTYLVVLACTGDRQSLPPRKAGLLTSLDFMSNKEIGRMPAGKNPGNEKQEHLNSSWGVNRNRKPIASPVASGWIDSLSLPSWHVTLSTRQIKSSAQGGLVLRFHYGFCHWGHEVFSLPWSERNRKLFVSVMSKLLRMVDQ